MKNQLSGFLFTRRSAPSNEFRDALCLGCLPQEQEDDEFNDLHLSLSLYLHTRTWPCQGSRFSLKPEIVIWGSFLWTMKSDSFCPPPLFQVTQVLLLLSAPSSPSSSTLFLGIRFWVPQPLAPLPPFDWPLIPDRIMSEDREAKKLTLSLAWSTTENMSQKLF